MSPRALRGPATVTAVVASALAAGLLAAPQSETAAEVRIHDIQGTTRISPFACKHVS